MKCQGGCKAPEQTSGGCFECYEPDSTDAINIAMDLANARSPPARELVPTFTTHNRRICLLLATGEMGRLRIEDAERLQVLPQLPLISVACDDSVTKYQHLCRSHITGLHLQEIMQFIPHTSVSSLLVRLRWEA
jgi:hypothetical protein